MNVPRVKEIGELNVVFGCSGWNRIRAEVQGLHILLRVRVLARPKNGLVPAVILAIGPLCEVTNTPA